MPWFTAGEPITAGKLNSLIVATRKTADEAVTSSTTLQDDNELAVTLEANSVYRVELYLVYSTPSTADLKIGWSRPSGETMRWVPSGADPGITGTNSNTVYQSRTGAETADLGGTGSTLAANPHGTIVTTSGGELRLQWAQSTSDPGSTIVRAWSALVCTKIG